MVNLSTAKMEAKAAKRILCIEDEPEMIDLIRLILSRRGFEVLGAAGGTAGIKAVREQLPDLVLLDLRLPLLSGHDVCIRLKSDKRFADIPIILFTASAGGMAEKARLMDADDYIIKPFDSEELLKKIKKLI